MAQALALAARGLGTTWPNPAVGCVLVKDGVIVGRGFTQAGGRPHAERHALAQAGQAAHGATAYVTLEPCAHYGKTPPCALGLIEAGVSRVVSALFDPDPRVAGKGLQMLRDAGISVTEGVLEAEARALNAGFLKRVTRGLPFVTLKLGTSIDGRIATSSGESRWITGPLARRHVHKLRLTHDAVMVGSGTALADDPDLTARDIGAPHQPLRIVLDRRLAHGPNSRLGRSACDYPVWIVHGPDVDATRHAAWRAAGAELIECPLTRGALDLTQAMKLLAARGVTRILSEGGGKIAAALVAARLVDDLLEISAGKLIGADGQPAIGALALEQLAQAPGFRLHATRKLGEDLLTHWILS